VITKQQTSYQLLLKSKIATLFSSCSTVIVEEMSSIKLPSALDTDSLGQEYKSHGDPDFTIHYARTAPNSFHVFDTHINMLVQKSTFFEQMFGDDVEISYPCR
jgi:hypothetical protein